MVVEKGLICGFYREPPDDKPSCWETITLWQNLFWVKPFSSHLHVNEPLTKNHPYPKATFSWFFKVVLTEWFQCITSTTRTSWSFYSLKCVGVTLSNISFWWWVSTLKGVLHTACRCVCSTWLHRINLDTALSSCRQCAKLLRFRYKNPKAASFEVATNWYSHDGFDMWHVVCKIPSHAY